jgi:hypothetical protein
VRSLEKFLWHYLRFILAEYCYPLFSHHLESGFEKLGITYTYDNLSQSKFQWRDEVHPLEVGFDVISEMLMRDLSLLKP